MTTLFNHITVIYFKRQLLFYFLLTSLLGCSSGSNYSDTTEEVVETAREYNDGTYCAEVEYYNPNTGTRSTYTLNVDVENNELVLIHWPNGGWLDDSHFTPVELDDNGFCYFTSDKGYEYEVQITGSECSYDDSRKARMDAEADEAEVTCPKCGNEKDSYDRYCQSCTDDLENTCSRCGGYEYNVNGGLCYFCKRNDEEDRKIDDYNNE